MILKMSPFLCLHLSPWFPLPLKHQRWVIMSKVPTSSACPNTSGMLLLHARWAVVTPKGCYPGRSASHDIPTNFRKGPDYIIIITCPHDGEQCAVQLKFFFNSVGEQHLFFCMRNKSGKIITFKDMFLFIKSENNFIEFCGGMYNLTI